MPPSAGQILFALVGLALPTGAFMADFFSVTHLFNPRWPPHAKFHTGQTLSMALVLGAATVYYAFVAPAAAGLSPAAQAAVRRQRLDFAGVMSSMYWITQLAATQYPGSMCVDPEFGEGCPQVFLSAGFLAATAAAYALERGRLMQAVKLD